MPLANQIHVRGNLLPEGMTVPQSSSWPPDAEDGQLLWHLPEQQLYVYQLASDSWMPVGSSGTPVHYERVLEQHAYLGSNGTFVNVRADFFTSRLNNRDMGTWDTLWKHCYWQFISPTNSGGPWTTPRKFSTQNDFFNFLESYVPNNGVSYTENVLCRCYEVVDDADTFPNKLVHRNSLAATMMGRKHWVDKRDTGYYGISSLFNLGGYYLNFYNQLGQRFVTHFTGIDPGSNNDAVIWWHRGTRGTLLRFPGIGLSVGGKGSAWDRVNNMYVPGSGRGYEVREPFYLVEHFRNKTLSITSAAANEMHRVDEMVSPVVAVFPLVNTEIVPGQWQYNAFMPVPVNFDNFVTEWIDTANYEVSLLIKYRGTLNKIYDVATRHLAGSAHAQVMMWNSLGVYWHRNSSRLESDIDGDYIPIGVDLARRNLTTGVRSRWTALYKVRRHTAHAGIRTTPMRGDRR